jgi:site-specific recombinase XerC
MSDNLTATELRQLMAEAQRLIDSIEPWTLASIRNRAIIGVMGYTSASLDAVLGLRVRDYFVVGDRRWLRFTENGVEQHALVDRRLERLIEPYLAEAGVGGEPDTVLFRSIAPRQRISARSVARRKIVQLIQSLEPSSDYPAETTHAQNKMQNLIQYVNGSNTLALRDRAILGVIAYAGASVLDIVAMKVSDFYKRNGAYWVNISGRQPVRVAPELATLLQDYCAGVSDRASEMTFLFGLDRLHPLTPSDVHKIFERYRIKANAAPEASAAMLGGPRS